MKPQSKETQTDIKTRVLDLIQRQIDHTARTIELSIYVNHELSAFSQVWSSSNCSEEDFKNATTQLNTSLITLSRVYENEGIRRVGANIHRLAHSGSLIDISEMLEKYPYIKVKTD